MRHQTKKSLTPGGKSGRSKIIQLETLNSLYFSMILSDSECAIFCCQILDHFESLMNKHYKGESGEVESQDYAIKYTRTQRE